MDGWSKFWKVCIFYVFIVTSQLKQIMMVIFIIVMMQFQRGPMTEAFYSFRLLIHTFVFVFPELLREIDRLKSEKTDDVSGICIEPVKAEVEILKERLIEANSKLAEATR